MYRFRLGKHEHVGSSIDRSQRLALQRAEKTPRPDSSAPARSAPGRRRRSPWCRADRDRETPRDSFPPRPGRRRDTPASAGTDRHRAAGNSEVSNATRPQHDVAKPARAQFGGQRRGRGHHGFARAMKPAQGRPHPGFRHRRAGRDIIGEAGVKAGRERQIMLAGNSAGPTGPIGPSVAIWIASGPRLCDQAGRPWRGRGSARRRSR